MRDFDKPPSLVGVALVSIALHAGAAFSLAGGAHAAEQPRHAPVRITVHTVQPERPELPAPEPAAADSAPLPAPVPQAPRAKAKRNERSESTPAKQATPAEGSAAPVFDLTGVTLTSPNGASLQQAGNGQASAGALAPIGRRVVSQRGTSTLAGEAGAGVVALASLSRPPHAPALDAELALNYPAAARDRGEPGEAWVRVQILASGKVGATSVLRASTPEFARACLRTLASSRWTPPLAANGQPVATEVSYKCKFEVTR